MQAEEASALETTLARLRQRYALHFYLPSGVAPGQEREIAVELSEQARRRYPDAQVRYRRVYMTPGGANEPVTVSHAPAATQPSVPQPRPAATEQQPSSGGWRRAEEPKTRGWRKLGPGEQP
jgi:hypothetical protein